MIVVGRIGSAQGIQGWVRVQSFTEPPGNILNYTPWFIERNKQWQILTVAETRYQGEQLLAKLADYPSREAVKTLANVEIAVRADCLPHLTTGEHYWRDLIGLVVINKAQVNLGTVQHLLETGSNDVLVVRDGEKERLLPYLPEQVILAVDLTKGIITVDWDADF